MKLESKTNQKSPQEIQDDIFRSMSADRKLAVGSQFWRLAKDLIGDKIHYGKHRPATSVGKNFKTA